MLIEIKDYGIEIEHQFVDLHYKIKVINTDKILYIWQFKKEYIIGGNNFGIGIKQNKKYYRINLEDGSKFFILEDDYRRLPIERIMEDIPNA